MAKRNSIFVTDELTDQNLAKMLKDTGLSKSDLIRTAIHELAKKELRDIFSASSCYKLDRKIQGD